MYKETYMKSNLSEQVHIQAQLLRKTEGRCQELEPGADPSQG